MIPADIGTALIIALGLLAGAYMPAIALLAAFKRRAAKRRRMGEPSPVGIPSKHADWAGKISIGRAGD